MEATGFGVRLRACRDAAGLSQEELAERSGLGLRTIGNLERGRTRWPHPDTLLRLADGLELRHEARAAFLAGVRHRPGRVRELTDAASGSLGHRDTAIMPRQLPAAVACFTGRRAELSALTGSLDASAGTGVPAMAICSVGGVAGVGKTALAVQWARQAAERFPDGQLYVNLRGYDPDQPVAAADALASLLGSLGVPGDQIPDGAEDRARLYRSRLAGRRMLVLLDNARDADQVRPLLPGDPGCVVVVTSRDALAGLVAADGARRLDLDLLPQEDAVTLLRSLIGCRVDDDPAAAAELARLCGGLPLALRVAAELAASRPGMPLTGLVAELSASLLDCLDAGEDCADVRTVFSWSFRHLPDTVAAAFTLTGLAPGADLDVHAVAALIGTTTRQARRALVRLHRASLIQVSGSGRYGMHDLLRAYAREQAAARDTGGSCHRALTRLFDYYLAGAAAAMDLLYPAEANLRPHIAQGQAVVPVMQDRVGARAWLDREHANLVTAVVHCSEHGWPGHATSLAATLFRYLMAGSHLYGADTIYRHALHAARLSGDLAAEAAALTGLGGIGIEKGRFRDAADHFQDALERYRRCGDLVGQGRVLCNLGHAEQDLRNFQSAAGYCSEAIAAFEDAGDRLGAARSLSRLGGIEIELGLLEEAAGHLQSALHVLHEENDQPREAEALGMTGHLALRRGQLTQAAVFFEQALTLWRRVGQLRGVAIGLRNLGEASLRQGICQQAISCLRQGLALFVQTGDQHGEAVTRRVLAEALLAAGQPAAARSELKTALRLAAATGNTYEQATAHRDLAESHHQAGQDKQAHFHWEQALILYTQLGAPEAGHVRSRLGG